MNWEQVVERCCRDLRRYLEKALAETRGGVVSVKLQRLLRAELPQPDLVAYATCLRRILGRYRWGKSYVIPRSDVEKILETFDKLCRRVKRKTKRWRRRKPKDKTQREEMRLIAVQLSHDLLRAVDEYAAARGMSRSAVIRQAIQQLIDMRETLEEVNKAKDGKLELVSLRIPVSLLNAVNEYAAGLKTTRSALVRYAVAQMLEKIKTEQQLAQVAP